mmetsp:Transcript_22859/g.35178  ORF Transcript_22859/g.35178 Transcript_22859/m.35178 type:complete len:228 (+) Transcript_22859:926-1609(+)
MLSRVEGDGVGHDIRRSNDREFVRGRELVVAGALLVRGEVIDLVPLVHLILNDAFVVGELANDVSIIGVLLQQGVLEVVGRQLKAGRALDDGIVGSVQEELGVEELTAAELGSGDGHLAARAVSEEDGSLDGADVELAVLAAIDSDLGDVIEQEDLAVLKVLDGEVDAVDVAGLLDQHLAGLTLEDEVGSVELLLLGRLRGLHRLRLGGFLFNLFRGGLSSLLRLLL